MKDELQATVSLDWSKFFDSIQRQTAFAIMKQMMAPGSYDMRYLEAEERFVNAAKFRFKVGKAVSERAQSRTNGFGQGPVFSIVAAVGIMATWTRALEYNIEGTKTSGFVDDSSVRTKRRSNTPEQRRATVQDMQRILNFLPGFWPAHGSQA